MAVARVRACPALRAFFFAGARSLLVTHWDANDATTTYLTALFLQALNANPAAGPAMALAALHDGQRIRPRLIMPDFPSYLRVDYITHDGDVQHLYPQVSDSS